MRQSAEQRRLLAVLVADIVGYSRLMAEDEADTFYRVKDLQASLITPTTQRNHGRIVKWTGDGFIGTFDSAVDAVRAAIEIQYRARPPPGPRRQTIIASAFGSASTLATSSLFRTTFMATR